MMKIKLDYYHLKDFFEDESYIKYRVKQISETIHSILESNLENDFENLSTQMVSLDIDISDIVECILEKERVIKNLQRDNRNAYSMFYEERTKNKEKEDKQEELKACQEKLELIEHENKILKASLGLLDDLETLTVNELKEVCEMKGIKQNGRKQELIDRLTA